MAAPLPSARQKPAAHAVHAAALVKLVPPADHVPAPHLVEGVAEPVPVGQKKPAVQGFCVALFVAAAQK